MFVDSVTATFERDAWIKLAAQIKGTGKYTSDLVSESIEAAGNATSLTLASNAVAGSTAQERLDAVQQIIVELSTGVWTEVDYTAVSGATPAVITIVAPSESSDTVTYKVLYRPTEAEWCTFPARVTESPLRVSELTVVVGGNGMALRLSAAAH